MVPLWAVLSFLVGALPFSVWVGRYCLRRDITAYGDGNPGATNVLRAGGFLWFSLALALDISKGAAPVGLAYYVFGWQGASIVPVALAPPLGHAFSPFLGGRGGKSLATAFGVWIGLTLWPIPVVSLASLSLLAWLVAPSGWAVVGALFCILAALLLWLPDPALLAVWAGQVPLLVWSHRRDLRQRPKLRPSGRARGGA